MKYSEIEILRESFIDPEWLIARLKQAPDRVGIVPITYLKTESNDSNIEDSDLNLEFIQDEQAIWILSEKQQQLRAQLKQLADQCNELEELVQMYSNCVICLDKISTRCSLSCGHTFW